MKNIDNTGLGKGQNVLPANGNKTTSSAATPDSTQIAADPTSLPKETAPTTQGDADSGKRGGNNIAVVPPSGSEPESDPTSAPTGESEGCGEAISHPVSPFGVSADMSSPTTASPQAIKEMLAPENVRVSQDFIDQAGLETITGVLSVGRAGPQVFFRVREGSEWQVSAAVLEVERGIEKEIYVVLSALAAELADEVSYVMIRLAVDQYGVPFLWPLKVTRGGQKPNSWNQSAKCAAEAAIKCWVRMYSKPNAAQYSIVYAKNNSAEPEWPKMSFHEILELAFKDRIITDHNHPVLRQLRGEI